MVNSEIKLGRTYKQKNLYNVQIEWQNPTHRVHNIYNLFCSAYNFSNVSALQ